MTPPLKPDNIPEARWVVKVKATLTGGLLLAAAFGTFKAGTPPWVYLSLGALGLVTVDGEVVLAPLVAVSDIAVKLIRAVRGTGA